MGRQDDRTAASIARMTSPRGVGWFVWALLAAALLGWIAVIAAAWRSYYGMVPATGVVATLADAILRGQAPGHEDGSSFLVTFYLPPFPLLVAALHRIGLGWLVALRSASVLTGVLLLAASAWAALALGGGRRAALLAPALVLATYTFKASSIGGRADLLAAALSIAALGAWSRDEGARGWGAPALAAGAFLTKATALTVPIALVLWCLAHRRAAPLLRFGARFAACWVAGALLLLPIHGPRWYAEALGALVTATPSTSLWLRGPTELVRYLGSCGELAVFAALALALLASGAMRGRPSRAYGAASLAIAMYVMTNFGAGPNHLDEITCAAATWAAVWAAPRLSRPALMPAFALAIAVAGASWRDFVGPARHGTAPAYLRASLIGQIRAEPGDVLTEDALLSLAAGRRPAVSDPGALRSMSLKGDPRAMKVVERLAAGSYSLVVLNDNLDASARWYRNVHLGDRVTAAIRSRYREASVVDEYHLYRPAAR